MTIRWVLLPWLSVPGRLPLQVPCIPVLPPPLPPTIRRCLRQNYSVARRHLSRRTAGHLRPIHLHRCISKILRQWKETIWIRIGQRHPKKEREIWRRLLRLVAIKSFIENIFVSKANEKDGIGFGVELLEVKCSALVATIDLVLIKLIFPNFGRHFSSSWCWALPVNFIFIFYYYWFLENCFY